MLPRALTSSSTSVRRSFALRLSFSVLSGSTASPYSRRSCSFCSSDRSIPSIVSRIPTFTPPLLGLARRHQLSPPLTCSSYPPLRCAQIVDRNDPGGGGGRRLLDIRHGSADALPISSAGEHDHNAEI